MHLFLAVLFNGLLFFTGTTSTSNNQSAAEVSTPPTTIATPLKGMLDMIDLMYCTDCSMTVQVNFVVDENNHLHVSSIESPMANMNDLIKEKLDVMVQQQGQSFCIPANKQFSISLKLSYGNQKMS